MDERPFPTNDYWIVTALLAVAFVFAPLFPQNVHAGFAFFFRSVLFMLAGLAAYRLGAGAFIARLRGSPVFIPCICLSILLTVGLFYSPDVYRAKDKWIVTFCAFVLYAIVLSGPVSDKAKNALLWCLVFGGVMAALHGLYSQWIGHGRDIEAIRNSNLYPEEMGKEMIRALEANRALGRFGNPNQLAGYLALCLWPLWALWKRTNSQALRVLQFLLGLLFVWCLYRTFSRSGLLIFAMAVVLWLGFELYGRGFRISWKAIVGMVGAVLIVSAVGLMLLPKGFLGGRLLTVSTIVARMHFFRGALAIVSRYPWFGVGLEGYESYYCEFIRPGDLEAHYVHNVALESAVEGGVLGLLVFVWIVLAGFASLFLIWRRYPPIRIETFAAFGACLSLFCLSLVDFHNNLLDMWLAPVFLSATAHRVLPTASLIRIPRGVVVGCSVVLLSVWMLLVACRFWNENARFDGRYLFADGQKYEAREAYERAVLFDRTDAESWRQLSYLWAEIPNPIAQQRRLEYIQNAARWAPRRASVRADYADALFALGYVERALDQMLSAQRLFPSRPVYYERAAAIFRFLNRTDEADRQIQKSKELKKEIEANRI